MSQPAATTSTSVADTATAVTTAIDPFIPDELAAFGIDTITVGGQEWLVAVADTSAERADGLRGILEMGDVDGMLFAYEEPTSAHFTMRAVTEPLEIAFFAPDGSLLNILEMIPCPDDPGCPDYESIAPFQWALESFPGGVTLLSSDASIDVN